jgi:hypothetical protein
MMKRFPHSLNISLNSPYVDFRCEQHRHTGNFPCPWPECPNGIEDDKLIGTGLGLEEKVFERIAWLGDDGESSYYSWEEKDGFCGLSASNVVDREIQRQVGRQTWPTELVYHYTLASGLQGIIESRSIWLSDFSYLNDATEVRHGLGVARNVLEELRQEKRHTDSPELFNALLTTFSDEKHPRVCMACFSREGDSLSQWRAYGTVALGFRASPLMFGQNTMMNPKLQAVIYSPDKQRQQLRILFHHHSLALQKDLETHGRRMFDIHHDYVVGTLYSHIAFFKDEAFADEREYRLVYIENPELFEKIGIARAPKHFRSRGNILIPYVKSSDLVEELPAKLPLEEVIIGPQENVTLVERSVSEFLEAHGYNEVRVRRSRVPYRPLGDA